MWRNFQPLPSIWRNVYVSWSFAIASSVKYSEIRPNLFLTVWLDHHTRLFPGENASYFCHSNRVFFLSFFSFSSATQQAMHMQIKNSFTGGGDHNLSSQRGNLHAFLAINLRVKLGRLIGDLKQFNNARYTEQNIVSKFQSGHFKELCNETSFPISGKQPTQRFFKTQTPSYHLNMNTRIVCQMNPHFF